MRYHGAGLYQWDTWYHVEPDGTVHAFYLQQRRPGSTRSAVEADSIGHAVSRNLIDWEEHPAVVGPSPPGELGDLVNWTGSTVADEHGLHHLFYTIRSSATEGREQAIGLATSRDLWHWTKHPGNPVLTADPRWYNTSETPGPGGLVDCRDLMVAKHPSRPGWFGVFATRVVTDELPTGAVFAGAYSEDLLHWEQTPPVYRSDDDAYSIVEMPDLFELEGRWYLTWLEDNAYGNRDVLGDELSCGTVYAVADRIEGPYEEPPDNVLLASRGFNGISCRSLELDGRRYVLYTSCEREQENETKPTFGVLALPKELRLVDGRLRLCFAAELVLDKVTAALIAHGARAELVELHGMHESRGRWSLEGDARRGEIDTAWARQSFGPEATDFVLTVTVRVEHGVAAGLLIRQIGHRAGVALLDVAKQQVAFCTVPRFQTVDARRWPLSHGRDYRLRVLGNGEFVEVYVDDELVLQFVWYGARSGRTGVLVDRGSAVFTDVELLSLS